MKTYFEEVFEAFDNMSDEEFDVLILKSGIERCPIQEYKELYNKKVVDEGMVSLKNKIKFAYNEFNEFESGTCPRGVAA